MRKQWAQEKMRQDQERRKSKLTPKDKVEGMSLREMLDAKEVFLPDPSQDKVETEDVGVGT